MRKSLKKITAMLTASVLAMAVAVTAVPGTADAATTPSKAAKKLAKQEFDPAGTYHAYFGMQQTNTWIFRDPWCSETLGIDGTEFAESTTGATYSDLLKSGTDGLEKIAGTTVVDAEITGNGVYTVSVDGLNGALTADQTAVLSMVYVGTDVPVSAKGTFQISDVKLVMDDRTQSLPDEVYFNEEEEEATGFIRFDPVNTYHKDQGMYPDCPSVFSPTNSIKITFKVSGMAQDNPDAVEATPTPAPAAEDTADDAEDDTEGSGNGPLVAGIVVAVVVVIGAVVVVSKKKKK